MTDQIESSYKVRLYAYDLSNGLAKTMSRAWTGKYFEAIWHTSIVYDDQLEVFFGQGITTCHPGTSIHGRPIKTFELGRTQVDLGTLLEYIDELRSSWTAEAYHLLERNCNNFSNELAGFLTGASIPQEILDLPKDFLSTPFGAQMRPMIDQMFRGGNHPPPPTSHAPSNNPTSLLQDVAALSFNARSGTPAVKTCTTPKELSKLLEDHLCVVVNFTNERGCPPCKAIAPVYEALASEFSHDSQANEIVGQKRTRAGKVKDVVFVKVDTTTSGELAGKYSVRATPTIKFFVDRKEIGEVKGADAHELRMQVNLMLYTAYPPHIHAKLRLPRLKALSDQPIQYSQVPDLEKALSKLIEAVEKDAPTLVESATVFKTIAVPFLKGNADLSDPSAFTRWNKESISLITSLSPAQSFPVIDLLRLAVLKSEYVTKLAGLARELDPIHRALEYANDQAKEPLARPFSLTLLRLLSNVIGSEALAAQYVQNPTRSLVTQYVINMLLSEDESVRVTACSVCYGLVCEWSGSRSEWVKAEGEDWEAGLPSREHADDEEWEVELMSALIEALKREHQSNSEADVVHRLVATIGRLDYLSPYHLSSLRVLTETLNLTQILDEKKKLEALTGKKELRELCDEVKKMCAAS
ncbi:PPPDE putative peptidase domain-containing protein [Melampsora americana]|nr:PPPDE putative peptidase domain-containing protein [Melampsora americana]